MSRGQWRKRTLLVGLLLSTVTIMTGFAYITSFGQLPLLPPNTFHRLRVGTGPTLTGTGSWFNRKWRGPSPTDFEIKLSLDRSIQYLAAHARVNTAMYLDSAEAVFQGYPCMCGDNSSMNGQGCYGLHDGVSVVWRRPYCPNEALPPGTGYNSSWGTDLPPRDTDILLVDDVLPSVWDFQHELNGPNALGAVTYGAVPQRQFNRYTNHELTHSYGLGHDDNGSYAIPLMTGIPNYGHFDLPGQDEFAGIQGAGSGLAAVTHPVALIRVRLDNRAYSLARIATLAQTSRVRPRLAGC
jgi:hypothetical protein